MTAGRKNADTVAIAGPALLGTVVPAFSPIAIHLLGIVSQEDVGLVELAKLVRADPGLSVEVLRLANSPLFGAYREITSILHAIAMLGLKRLKSMVMTVAIRDFLAPARHGAVFAPCWRHSLATALVAEAFAAKYYEDADDAYTAGLLHEVGQLALIAAHPAAYEELARRSVEEGVPLSELERGRFGLNRHEAGVWLVERWKLPGVFRSAVDSTLAANGIGRMVDTCCRVAGLLGFRVGAEDETFDRTQLPGLPDGVLAGPEDLERLFTDVATRINTIECSLMIF